MKLLNLIGRILWGVFALAFLVTIHLDVSANLRKQIDMMERSLEAQFQVNHSQKSEIAKLTENIHHRELAKKKARKEK